MCVFRLFLGCLLSFLLFVFCFQVFCTEKAGKKLPDTHSKPNVGKRKNKPKPCGSLGLYFLTHSQKRNEYLIKALYHLKKQK